MYALLLLSCRGRQRQVLVTQALAKAYQRRWMLSYRRIRTKDTLAPHATVFSCAVGWCGMYDAPESGGSDAME